jgi:hypothetical protein
VTASRPIPDGMALLDAQLARTAGRQQSTLGRPFESLEASLGITGPAPVCVTGGEIPAYRDAMDRMAQQLRETGHSAAQADSIVRRCARNAHNQNGVTTKRR